MHSRDPTTKRPPWLARCALLTSIVATMSACDTARPTTTDGNVRRRAESSAPPNPVVWGCEQSIPELPKRVEPGWRDKSIVVGDFGFYSMKDTFSGFRPHERADIQVKLPILIEGRSAATVWIPARERDRVGLLLADVPTRGPGNSRRIEDGHHAVRFEPCAKKEWTAWTSGLTLADRRKIVVLVKVDDLPRPERVPLGPWESFTLPAALSRKRRPPESPPAT